MKQISFLIYGNNVLAVLFTLLCVSFHADVSLLAFPVAALFSAVLCYMTLFVLLKKNNARHLGAIKRLLQYEPFVFISAYVIRRAGQFGVPYALDLTVILLWLLLTVVSFLLLVCLGEKKLAVLNGAWAQEGKPAAKPAMDSGRNIMRRVGIELLEWIDALIQAVFTIVLLNIFLFQLYEIPSESMVPTFLIKDRVAVFKTLAGPKFPLSDIGLPYLQKYRRGDIVVFRNPHYASDRANEVKTFLSQFLYNLTLTLVKTNTDENGELKSDPLVKRVVGEPGEQLMLMDGNLYVRTKDSGDFKLEEKDALWAAWNLNTLPEATKKKIKWMPLTQAQAESTLTVETQRRSLNLSAAAEECRKLSDAFAALSHGNDAPDDQVSSLFTASELYTYAFLSSLNDNTVKLLTVDGGSRWFSCFMNGWYEHLGDLSQYAEQDSLTGSSLVGGNLYDDAMFRLNVMVKLVAGRIIVRNAQLLASSVSGYSWNEDEVRVEQFKAAQMLSDYILMMDQRNMPVFPANDASGNAQYIPEDCYFMMGDNRYNSLDMRHSYDQTLVPLAPADSYSLQYYTNIAPQYVHKGRILGRAGLRFWPTSRFGLLKRID